MDVTLTHACLLHFITQKLWLAECVTGVLLGEVSVAVTCDFLSWFLVLVFLLLQLLKSEMSPAIANVLL